MTLERMKEWISAAEYLINGDEGDYVVNDFGDFVKVEDMCGGRYGKYTRAKEFCGVVNSAAEAVLWLYEQNKADEGAAENDNAALEEEKRYKEFYERYGKDGWGDEYS